ncbi:MAG: urease accessory protein UreF [Pseudomonadota bacterium]
MKVTSTAMATTAMTDPQIAEAVLIQTWMSPAFPTGGFSYSHALETLVEDGRATTPDDVSEWLTGVLTHGSGWTDGILCREAWQAVSDADDERLSGLVELAAALAGTSEFHLESTSQGDAFLRAVRAGWPDLVPTGLSDLKEVAYPIAVGACCSAAGIGEAKTIAAFLSGVTAHLISAACRLVPLGQSDAQRVTAAINQQVPDLVDRIIEADFDALGSSAWAIDLASMAHETLHTRLFRS